MKFGKEYTSQMVPEWEEAYLKYNHLKTILKEILVFRRLKTSSPVPPQKLGILSERHSLYRAFSGLTGRFDDINHHVDDNDHPEVILVSEIQHQEQCMRYQTMFFRSSEEGAENELLFFRRLDEEFNKAICFYKRQVEDVVKEAEVLNKQMDALFALELRITHPNFHNINTPPNISGLSPAAVDQEIQEVDQETTSSPTVSLEILNHVKINVTPESAVSTLKTIFDGTKTDLSFSKRELRTAQAKLKQAFVEFYRKLRLLKSYCYLNQLAISKIMKKYDKVTSRNASKAYLEMVKNSYLSQSDEVVKLMERVEVAFITHFANANRGLGMRDLRPKANKDKHRITFFVGCFFGCLIALVVAVILTIHARDLVKSEGGDRYMINMFPLYSLFAYIVLHMLMYAANIYFWKRFRVNYTFIFGFKPNTELGYKEILLVSSALLVLTLAAVLSNLELEMDDESFQTLTELVPLGLLTVVGLILFCPFNIMYRASRLFLIVNLWHCVCAPLYKVTFPDFFLGDQLTSQVQLFRTVEFYICYYGWGDLKKRSNRCNESSIYEIFNIFLAVIPYWFRFLQCMRQVIEQKDYWPAMNGLKYLSTIVAVVTRTIYVGRKNQSMVMRIIAAASSGVATIYSTYWDMVMDWGLLCKNSKNRWLRDKLILPNKSVYFVAMVINVILRLAWMQTVLDFHEAPWLHRSVMIFVIACLEIVRRGLWNFFRVENEHLNNVGKFRAVKSVPLPFSYEDDDKEL